jgi:hypothetical protein
MSERKHTPGPLSFDLQDEEGFFRFFSIRTESGRSIGTVDNEYDARLFAAAPDMLQACEMALQDMIRWKIFGPGRNAVESAIKKAKGNGDE